MGIILLTAKAAVRYKVLRKGPMLHAQPVFATDRYLVNTKGFLTVGFFKSMLLSLFIFQCFNKHI